MDAANVDLKGFTEDFYFQQTGAHLAPVLDTLQYLRHETDCWFEITTLLIPGHNDSSAEIDAMTRWIAERLGPDVPLHFTAFHPGLQDAGRGRRRRRRRLTRARAIALGNGLHHVYTGNVHDVEGGTTFCPGCHEAADPARLVRGAVLPHRDMRRRARPARIAARRSRGASGRSQAASGGGGFRCAWRCIDRLRPDRTRPRQGDEPWT